MQNNPNLQIADLPYDRLVAEYPSQNDQYKKIVVRSGTKPVQPAGSVEIKRIVDNSTNLITVVYAFPADGPDEVDYDIIKPSIGEQNIVNQSAIPAIRVSNPTLLALNKPEYEQDHMDKLLSVIDKKDHFEGDSTAIFAVLFFIILVCFATYTFAPKLFPLHKITEFFR